MSQRPLIIQADLTGFPLAQECSSDHPGFVKPPTSWRGIGTNIWLTLARNLTNGHPGKRT